MIPLTPTPFMPGSGVPELLRKHYSVNPDGMVYTLFDQERNTDHVISFFDNKIFFFYKRFIKKLSSYLLEKNICTPIYGMNCGYISKGTFHSFFYDQSRIYEKFYLRYLNISQEESNGMRYASNQVGKSSKDFSEIIYDVYRDELVENFHNLWEGTVHVTLLGVSPDNFAEQLYSVPSQKSNLRELITSISTGSVPNLNLLSNDSVENWLRKVYESLVTDAYLSEKFGGKRKYGFVPLSFMEFYDVAYEEINWRQMGLWQFLKNHYQGCYTDCRFSQSQSYEDENPSKRVSFICGSRLDNKSFNQMLKGFFNGGQIVLEKGALAEALQRRLELLVLENSLEVERVEFLGVEMERIHLGTGWIIILDGRRFNNKSDKEKEKIWSKIIATFDLEHFLFDIPKDVDCFWQVRIPSHDEIKYKDIRRLWLFNFSSYHKHIRANIPNRFNLLKISEQSHVKFENLKGQLRIEMPPNSLVALDFGVIL